MNKERRRNTRLVVEIDAEVLINGKRAGLVTDLSEAGLFVETSAHIETGNFAVIKFSSQTIMFGATVRRVTGRGFGAEFGYMNAAHREVISRLLQEKGRVNVVLPHLLIYHGD